MGYQKFLQVAGGSPCIGIACLLRFVLCATVRKLQKPSENNDLSQEEFLANEDFTCSSSTCSTRNAMC
ncbi:hypothetical protein Y1Q_0005332 [Alligator mississippiensis]|uniref:Uncharacterized protein n=1 Tax=Alligator mississippiensis TaxID=8496 RepID=A0A151MVK4_ALLMI|nr:hypothetical protein Y1Q_0005332 [Alligator mississippiensis]